jgi:hypothetical protein
MRGRYLVQYVFLVKGRLGTSLDDVLHPVSVRLRDDATEITLEIEVDAQLYGVLAKLERLGISIVSFEPEASATGGAASSSSTGR